ncbi:MAG: methylmalonyl-CoA epimerase [Thermoleophilia bacterium]
MTLSTLGPIHHVGYVVPDLDVAIAEIDRTLGVAIEAREVLAEQDVEAVMLTAGSGHVELITPRDPEGAIARFMDKRGPGLHHIAFEVADIEAALEDLRLRGVELIDQTARRGLGGHLVAFIHPRSALGVLTEIVQADHPPAG